MSDTPMPWVKLHTQLLDNPLFGRLPETTQARYFKLTMLAGRLDAGGLFFKDGKQLTQDEIAWALRCDLLQLEEDIKRLSEIGLIHVNGSGPELTKFVDEQGPSQEEKRAAWKARQDKHRGIVTSDKPVNNAPQNQSQNQSQNQTENQNQSEPEPETPRMDNTWISKEDLLKAAAIPDKYHAGILSDPEIGQADILAELARNYARQGDGKRQVKYPCSITGMNLLKHLATPREWYEQTRWINHLPKALLQKIGLSNSEPQNGNKPVIDIGYTNNTELKKAADFMGMSIPEYQEYLKRKEEESDEN